MKVLVIEDDTDIRNIIKDDELENYAIETVTAKTAVEAYKILYKFKKLKDSFDYIIVDICLPDQNGVEIIKLVKQVFTTTKVVVFTGSFNDYREKCSYDYYFEKGTNIIQDITDIIIKDFLSKYS